MVQMIDMLGTNFLATEPIQSAVQAPALQATGVQAFIQAGAISNLLTESFTNIQFAAPLDRPVVDKALDTPSLTLQRVEPFDAVYFNARHTFLGLRTRAADRQGAAESLINRVKAFLARADLGFQTELRSIAPELHDASGNFVPAFKGNPPNVGDVISGSGATAIKHNAQSALFAASSVLTDDVRTMEQLRTALSTLRRRKQQELERRRTEAADLTRQMVEQRAALDQAERARVEAADDYGVAQRLLAEHWADVERRHVERARILNNHQGLYAVKVRETPVSHTLPDPLALRGARIDDIVPGCPAEPVPVAPALRSFLDAVLDIPVADWVALGDITPLLPGRAPLLQLVQVRMQKLQWRVAQPAPSTGSLHPTLLALHGANREAAREWLVRPFDSPALAALQQQGRRILALDDLLASPLPALRAPAQALLGRLQAAAGCLLARMRGVPPSLRLDWGNAADADRLPVEQPERWPGLAVADDDDFNATRTLVELVGWWFAQLDADASGASRTAMRNFVRACLVLAASDDPQQMLQGRVKSLPPRFAVGALLLLQLNREPLPGSMLQLFDDAQRVIGLLRVDDHDEGGTVARIASVYDGQAVLNTAMQVSGLLRAG